MKIYTLEFEKPIVELEQTLEALHKQAQEQKIDLSAQITRHRGETRSHQERDLHQPHRLAARPTGAAPETARTCSITCSASPPISSNCTATAVSADDQAHRRRTGHDRRASRDGHRPAKRPRHERESDAQFRQPASRRLPQSAAPDATGREIRSAR